MKRIFLTLTLVFLLIGSRGVWANFDDHIPCSENKSFKVTKALDNVSIDVGTKLSKIINDVADGARGTKTTVSLATRFAHLVKPWLPESSLKHIFEGVVDSNGYASGFHHLPSANGAKILRIELPPNKFGVYSAKVEINGIEKGPISTFFPDHWSREKVAEAIEKARLLGDKTDDPKVLEYTHEGVKLWVVFTDSSKTIIKTAFPKL